MTDKAQALLDRLKKLYRVPAFGPKEDFSCGLLLQSIYLDGYTDENIQELVDLGLIERYGTILTGYKLTKKAIREFWGHD